MLNDSRGDETSNAMRKLTIDEVESVSGGTGTTMPPPADCGCGREKCGGAGKLCRC